MGKITLIFLVFILILFSSCSQNSLPVKCYAKVEGIGDGFMEFSGFEYDNRKNICIEKTVSGFDYSTPFKTIKKCKSICEWNYEIQKLIHEGCTEIQIDVDRNICSLNEEKTEYQYCTEMLTTQKLNLPKCVSYD